MSKHEFAEVIHNVTVRRRARNERQVQDAIEFLYTWWVNPDNSTARRKMLIDVSIDCLLTGSDGRVTLSMLGVTF